MLWDDLKKRNIQAMKDKDQVSRGILSIVLNKILLLSIEKKTKGEELVDSDVLVILQKESKLLDEQILEFEKANRPERVEEFKKQKALIEGYLPKLMSDEEIMDEINKLADKSIQNIMKHFKVNFTGKCDMKKVSEIAKKC